MIDGITIQFFSAPKWLIFEHHVKLKFNTYATEHTLYLGEVQTAKHQMDT